MPQCGGQDGVPCGHTHNPQLAAPEWQATALHTGQHPARVGPPEPTPEPLETLVHCRQAWNSLPVLQGREHTGLAEQSRQERSGLPQVLSARSPLGEKEEENKWNRHRNCFTGYSLWACGGRAGGTLLPWGFPAAGLSYTATHVSLWGGKLPSVLFYSLSSPRPPPLPSRECVSTPLTLDLALQQVLGVPTKLLISSPPF